MRFVRGGPQVEVVNLEGGRLPSRHGPLLPDNVRAVVCGSSGCGKTNAVLSLLLSRNGVRFQNVYVYSKSLEQSKYRHLGVVLGGLPEVGYHTFDNTAEVVAPEEAGPDSVFIFDDISQERQDVVRGFFSRGRHYGVNSFYLCQSFAQAPKHGVRDNVNVLLIFEQDDGNLEHVYRSHVNTDLSSFRQFRELCRRCWSQKHNFLFVNKDLTIPEGRYRSGFNTQILPEVGQSSL